MSRPAWKPLALLLLTASLSFLAGRWSARTAGPAPAPATQAAFLDEMAEVAARYAAEDDATRALDVGGEEKARRWEDIRSRRRAEIRSLYERHGRTPPP
jgi:hypothetical protein